MITGASGLTGRCLTDLLLEENYYDKVKIVVRKRIEMEHPRLEQIVCDFEQLPEEKLVADDCFCCLGTTIKKAGSKEAFEKVDYHYPLEFAQIALKNGATQFAIITAIGADSNSAIFYSRVKGNVEKALMDLHFPNLMIFRPSLLLGDRSEKRTAERIGIVLARVVNPLIPRRYRGIEACQVAKAMCEMAKKGLRGVQIVESKEIELMAGL